MMGYMYVLFYCVFNAYSFVFISTLGDTHAQSLSIVTIFSLGLLLFNLLNIMKLGTLYKKLSRNLFPVVGINITSAASWLACFYALRFIDPASMLCIAMAIIPLTTLFMSTPLRLYKNNLPIIFSIVVVIFSMAIIINQNILNLGSHSSGFYFFIGVIISIVGGIFGGAIGIYSERLHKANFTVSEILAVRFYFLIIVAVAVALFSHSFNAMHWSDLKIYSFSAVIVIILPLVIYQKAISHLGSMVVSVLIPFTPILAYFMQLMIRQYPFHLGVLLSILLCSLTICALNIMRHRQQRQKKVSLSEA